MANKSMPNLKSCPFCGWDEPRLLTIEADGHCTDDCSIHCLECGSLGGNHDSASAAIAAWNRRAPSVDVERIADRIDIALGLKTIERDVVVDVLRRHFAVPPPSDERREAWRPMNTAPLDGTEVLLRVVTRAGISGKMLVGHFIEGGHCIEDHPPVARGWYFWNGCIFDRASEPMLWMPLPPTEAAILAAAKEGE